MSSIRERKTRFVNESAAGRGVRSANAVGFHLVQKPDVCHREPLLPRRCVEAIVERDYFQRCWPPFSRQEGRRKLQRVSRTKRMHSKKPDGRFSDGIARVDLVPAGCELFKPFQRSRDRSLGKRAITFKASQGRYTFDSRPHHTSIEVSSAASARKRRVAASATRSGTIAEASQNLTDPPAARKVAPARPTCRASRAEAYPRTASAAAGCGPAAPPPRGQVVTVGHRRARGRSVQAQGGRPDDPGRRSGPANLPADHR
jgi:hypothetical protein